jgi:eukaryotic-like serine/threonine-protein kinase
MQVGRDTLSAEPPSLDRTLARGNAAASDAYGPTTLPTNLGETLSDGDCGQAGEVHVGGLRRGGSIGRFVMIDLLGGGGMGEVYLCYDPELDRRVAVKLLRPLRGGREGEAPARLLREARAIARLSHPNVVTVHDVSVWEGRVFLAMEYVAGPTLAAWAREHHGDWAAIVAVYRLAGEGLAAAHRAGLVHRDFKPDNVLVDEGGRPRVLDFGIARAAESAGSHTSASTLAQIDTSLDLTTTGMLLGTPAYMAPEQLTSMPVDARTDQFSFCIALWEALYGQRPFAGDALASLTANVLGGRLRAPPRESRVPERVERALRRGLALDPDARFPDMPALLAALAPPRSTQGRWMAALVAAGAAAGAAAWSLGGDDPAAACTGDATLLAGAWDETTREAGAAAFAGSGAPQAVESWAQVLRIAGDWQTRWLAARARACDDTHAHHRQSLPALDLRLACLSRQVRDLGARAELWASADLETVRRAVESASALPRPETCDLEADRRRGEAPPEAVVAEVEAVHAALARVRALNAAGKYSAAVELAELQQAPARAHLATEAEARLALGTSLELDGQPQPARTALHGATRLALQAGDDELALAAAVGLAAVVGIRLSRYDEGEGWLQVAEGLAARVPEGSEHIHLERVGCSYHNDRGQHDVARPHCERSVQLAEALTGAASLETAHTLVGLANNNLQNRNPELARPLLARAWDIERGLLGDRHPGLVGVANSRAAAEYIAGDLDAAIARWEEGLAIAEATVGPDHLQAGLIHINLAVATIDLRAWDRVERELAALERIYLPIQGQLSSPLVFIHFVRGRLALARGDLPRARENFEQQLHYARQTRSAEHPEVLKATLELADVLAQSGEPRASELRHGEALALADKLADPESRALALRGLCRARVLLGRPAEALADCEQALTLTAELPRSELLRAEIRAWLARALLESGQDAARGESLASAARSELTALAEPGREVLALLDRPAPV